MNLDFVFFFIKEIKKYCRLFLYSTIRIFVLEDINYNEIINTFIEGAESLCPLNFKSSEKRVLVTAVSYYSQRAVAYIKDDKQLDAYMKSIYVQIVGEWTFHKTISFISAGLPIKYLKSILNSLFDGINSVCIQKMKEKVPINDLLDSIETKVEDVWIEEILKLKKSNFINSEQYHSSLIITSIDDLVNNPEREDNHCFEINKEEIEQKVEVKEQNEYLDDDEYENYDEYLELNDKFSETRYFDVDYRKKYLVFCALLLIIIFFISPLKYLFFNFLSILLDNIFLFFKNQEHSMYYVITFIIFLCLLFVSKINKENKLLLTELDNIKKKHSDLVKPASIFEKLSSDEIVIVISAQMSIYEEDLDSESKILRPLVSALRQRYTDEYGYIFPLCRIIDDSTLNDFEYEIYIKQNLVFKGEIQSLNLKSEYAEIIISNLKRVLIQNVDFILSREYVDILLENSKQYGFELQLSFNPVELDEKGITRDFVLDVIINLLREYISVKNTFYIFQLIVLYYDFYKTPDEISERIREDLSQKISNNLSDEENSIYAYSFDDSYENFLKQKIEIVENSKKIVLSDTEESALISKIFEIINSNSKTDFVLICDSFIRLPLFRLLSKYFDEISVISNKEISIDKNLVILDSIKGEFDV